MKFTKGNYKILCGKYKNFDEAVIHTVEGYLFEYDGIKFGMSKTCYNDLSSPINAKLYTITEISTGLSTELHVKNQKDVEELMNNSPHVIEQIKSNNDLIRKARNKINISSINDLVEQEYYKDIDKKENNMTNKERFIYIVNNNIKREGINKLMSYLERHDFYEAPASTRYHDAYEGGLLDHSLRTYYRLKDLVEHYKIDTSEETIAIIALFHDLCKVDCYIKEMRWRKNEQNEWEQYPTYKFEEQRPYGNHGGKSVFICMNYMKLTFEEASAIQSHMGMSGDSSDLAVGTVFRSNPLPYLLHVADMESTIPFFNENDDFEPSGEPA